MKTEIPEKDKTLPSCPECGADSELLKQEIEENWTGILIVDYLSCTNPQCKGHIPPVERVA